MDALLFKNELCEEDDDYGPVRVRRGGEISNYEDHPELTSPISGKPLPQWFSRTRATAIATELKLPFQET